MVNRNRYRVVLMLAVALLAGCAVRYKSGANCWSAEMISTEDWCEKQNAQQSPLPVYVGSEADPGVKALCDRLRASAAYREQVGFTCTEEQP